MKKGSTQASKKGIYEEKKEKKRNEE